MGSDAQALRDDAFELVQRARRGDFEAYRTLMRQNNQRLFRIARAILRDDDNAADVVQEAYVKAFCHLDDFVGPQGFRTWLAQIAKNEALQRLRQAKRMVVVDDRALEMAMTAHSDRPRVRQPDECLQNQQLRSLLEREIDQLPDPFRATFVLRGVEQLSVQETAAILGTLPGTIKTQYHRARKMLKARLTATMSDGRGSADDVLAGTQHLAFEFAGERCDRLVDTVCERLRRAARESR